MLEIIIVVILIVLVVALFGVSYVRKKKYNTELGAMREELKKGDKVLTDSGIVGEVVDSFTEDEYKYFVLKSGKGEHVGYYTVHANAIYYVYGKEDKAQEKVVVKVAPKPEKVAEKESKPKEIKPEAKEEVKEENKTEKEEK